MARLTRDLAASGAGLLRLARGDPRWAAAYDLGPRGFFRSFAGPLLALPLYVLADALVGRVSGEAVSGLRLAGAALAQLLDAFGFALLMAGLARPLRFQGGYGLFITVYNWASPYLTLALLAISLLTLLGAPGAQAFQVLAFVLILVAVFLTARMARETLSRELAPVALVVVLSVAWGACSDQTVSWLLSKVSGG